MNYKALMLYFIYLFSAIAVASATVNYQDYGREIKISSRFFTCGTVTFIPKVTILNDPAYTYELRSYSHSSEKGPLIEKSKQVFSVPITSDYDWAGIGAQNYYIIRCFRHHKDKSDAAWEQVSTEYCLDYRVDRSNIPYPFFRRMHPDLALHHTVTAGEYAAAAALGLVIVGGTVATGYAVTKGVQALIKARAGDISEEQFTAPLMVTSQAGQQQNPGPSIVTTVNSKEQPKGSSEKPEKKDEVATVTTTTPPKTDTTPVVSPQVSQQQNPQLPTPVIRMTPGEKKQIEEGKKQIQALKRTIEQNSASEKATASLEQEYRRSHALAQTPGEIVKVQEDYIKGLQRITSDATKASSVIIPPQRDEDEYPAFQRGESTGQVPLWVAQILNTASTADEKARYVTDPRNAAGFTKERTFRETLDSITKAENSVNRAMDEIASLGDLGPYGLVLEKLDAFSQKLAEDKKAIEAKLQDF